MMQLAGALVVIIGLLGLFALDRLRRARTSQALWIPVAWLFIAGSRQVSLWLSADPLDFTDRNLDGSPFDRNIFAVLIAAALIVLIARRRKVGTLLRANGPILLFLLFCGASVLWSDFPDVAFKRWIRALGDIAMVLVVLTDPDSSAAVKGFLARTSFLILPFSVLADMGRGFIGRGYRYGLTTNKNTFGLIGMVLGLTAVWRFLTILRHGEREGSTRRLIAHGSLVAMAMWCLWTANSLTSTACFLLGSTLIVLTNRWALARKPAVVHLVVASLIFLALYATILNPNVGIVSTMGKDPTLTGRTELWSAVIAMNPSPWFGAGFESFWMGSRLTKLGNIFVWRPNEAHNGYIEVYLNLGWTGVILLAVVMMTGYRKIVRGFRQDRDTGSLMLAYFFVAVIYSLTEAGFRIFSPVWITLLVAIIGVPKPRAQQNGGRWQAGSVELWPEKPSQVLAAAGPPTAWRGC
jgi:exopolysaccharide production protein ExoQ